MKYSAKELLRDGSQKASAGPDCVTEEGRRCAFGCQLVVRW